MPSEQCGDLLRKFGIQDKGITLTTVHGTAGGYDRNGSGNGSNDALNRLPHIRDPNREYLVEKTFEVTATERSPVENV